MLTEDERKNKIQEAKKELAEQIKHEAINIESDGEEEKTMVDEFIVLHAQQTEMLQKISYREKELLSEIKRLKDENSQLKKLLQEEQAATEQNVKPPAKEIEKYTFDVGGQIYATTSDTLRKSDPESLFQQFTNGNSPWPRDSSDKFFIDRDGNTFVYILNYLRDGSVKLPTKELKARVIREAKYYQLIGLVNILSHDKEENIPIKSESIIVNSNNHASSPLNERIQSTNIPPLNLNGINNTNVYGKWFQVLQNIGLVDDVAKNFDKILTDRGYTPTNIVSQKELTDVGLKMGHVMKLLKILPLAANTNTATTTSVATINKSSTVKHW